MKKKILTENGSYVAPAFDVHFVKVDAGFGNSLGLGDLETEEGELFY